MFPRSRKLIVTLAATAALAGGAVAHAATGTSSSVADPSATPAAAIAGDTGTTHAKGDCPNMGGDESTPSTNPSTTPSSDSSTSYTSSADV